MIIEETLIKYLQDANITGVGSNIYAETPRQVPDTYIVIDKTGSQRTDGIDRATVAIQSISTESLLKAATLNEEVLKLMEGFRAIENIFGAHLQADYNFTNTLTKQYRYQAVYEIYYKRLQ